MLILPVMFTSCFNLFIDVWIRINSSMNSCSFNLCHFGRRMFRNIINFIIDANIYIYIYIYIYNNNIYIYITGTMHELCTYDIYYRDYVRTLSIT